MATHSCSCFGKPCTEEPAAQCMGLKTKTLPYRGAGNPSAQPSSFYRTTSGYAARVEGRHWFQQPGGSRLPLCCLEPPEPISLGPGFYEIVRPFSSHFFTVYVHCTCTHRCTHAHHTCM